MGSPNSLHLYEPNGAAARGQWLAAHVLGAERM